MSYKEVAEQSALYAQEVLRLQVLSADLLAALEEAAYLIKEGGFTHSMTEEHFDFVSNKVRAAIAEAKGAP